MYPTGFLLYNRRREIAVAEPGHAADPFAGRSSDSLTAAVGVVWRPAGSRAKPLPGINPHRTAQDSPAASFNLRLSEILPGPVKDFGGLRREDFG